MTTRFAAAPQIPPIHDFLMQNPTKYFKNTFKMLYLKTAGVSALRFNGKSRNMERKHSSRSNSDRKYRTFISRPE
jgi:hypothetical protein